MMAPRPVGIGCVIAAPHRYSPGKGGSPLAFAPGTKKNPAAISRLAAVDRIKTRIIYLLAGCARSRTSLHAHPLATKRSFPVHPIHIASLGKTSTVSACSDGTHETSR